MMGGKINSRLLYVRSKILFEISVNQEKGESHLVEWPSLKSLQIANAGEGVEKREPSDTVGEAVN